MDPIDLSKVAPGPYSAPSAAVYGADGLMVCSLGTSDAVKAYRKRGDGNGAMIAATAGLLAASHDMVDMLVQVEHWMSGYGTATQSEMREKVRSVLRKTGL